MTISSTNIDDTKPVFVRPMTQSTRDNFTEIKTQLNNAATDIALNGDNVKWFNAVGDGVTDDTTAIHSARDGGVSTIIFPAGTYLVSGLTANVAGQEWNFENGASLKLADSSNTHTISVTAADVKITNCELNGNKANQTAGDGILITADRCTIKDGYVYDTFVYGVHAQNCNKPKIINNRVEDTASIAIFVETTESAATYSGAIIKDNNIDRTSLGAGISEGGIKIHGETTDGYYNRSRVINNDVLMPVSPTSSAANCIEVWGLAYRTVVSGNTTEGGSMGVSMDRANGGSVTGNTIFNAKTYGIELAWSDSCAVNANTIDGNGLTAKGITTTNTASNINAIGINTITNCNGNSVHLNTGSDYNAIVGNAISNPVSDAFNIQASDYVALVGNIANGEGTGTKGAFIDSSSSIVMAANVCTDFTQKGATLFGDSAVTLDRIMIIGNEFESTNGGLGDQLSGGAALGQSITYQANFSNIGNIDILDYSNNVITQTDSGAPESVRTAGVGSLYYRRNGGASTTLYVKESGTGSSGWVAK